MAVEYWSEEELEEYYDHPEIFIRRANELRAKMIREMFVLLKNRIVSIFR